MFDVVNETIINLPVYKQQNPRTGLVKKIPAFNNDANGFFVAKRGYFKKEDVSGVVTRTKGWDAIPDKIVLTEDDLAAFVSGNPVSGDENPNFRIVIFGELSSGSDDGAFAHMNPVKGRPEIYEFGIDTSAATILDQIADKIQARNNNYPSLVSGVYVDDSGADPVLVITAANGYIRFRNFALEYYDKKLNSSGIETGLPVWNNAKAIKLVNGKIVVPGVAAPDSEYIQGTEGFGTYEWMIQNLKLPTDINRSIVADNRDENPIPGMIYDQFTWYTEKANDLGSIQTIVGGAGKTKVGHTFYVPQGIAVPADLISATTGVIAANTLNVAFAKILKYVFGNAAPITYATVAYGSNPTNGDTIAGDAAFIAV